MFCNVFETMNAVYRKSLIWQSDNVSIQAGSLPEVEGSGSLVRSGAGGL